MEASVWSIVAFVIGGLLFLLAQTEYTLPVAVILVALLLAFFIVTAYKDVKQAGDSGDWDYFIAHNPRLIGLFCILLFAFFTGLLPGLLNLMVVDIVTHSKDIVMGGSGVSIVAGAFFAIGFLYNINQKPKRKNT